MSPFKFPEGLDIQLKTKPTIQFLPNEIVILILKHLEYASEVNALAQICRDFHAIASYHLRTHYSKTASAQGLIRVIKNNDVPAVQMLLSAWICFPIPRAGRKESCPIFQATRSGQAQILRMLIDYILRCFPRNCKSCSWEEMKRRVILSIENGLEYATHEACVDILKVLMELHTLIDSSERKNLLVRAAKRGRLFLVKYLVEFAGVSVSENLLGKAAEKGNLEVVEYLLPFLPDLQHFDNPKTSISPLAVAAINNHGAVEQCLLSHGAHLGPTADIDFNWLVFNSSEYNYSIPESIRKMVDTDALMNINDLDKLDSILVFAVATGNELLFQRLIKRGYPKSLHLATVALEFAIQKGYSSTSRTVFKRLVQLVQRDGPEIA